MKIIIEDREFIKDLERLQYEVQARKNIIGYMLESNIKNECFEQYHAEYLDFFTKYEKKKHEVEIFYVKPAKSNAKNWNLDFNSGELTID
jgi:hypothetical protein